MGKHREPEEGTTMTRSFVNGVEPSAQAPDFHKTLMDTLIVAGQQQLQETIAEQPWFRKYSNTFTALATGLTAFVVWAAGNGIGLPDYVQIVIGVLLVALQTLGVKATKNGITESTVQKITTPEVMGAVATAAEGFVKAQLESALTTGKMMVDEAMPDRSGF